MYKKTGYYIQPKQKVNPQCNHLENKTKCYNSNIFTWGRSMLTLLFLDNIDVIVILKQSSCWCVCMNDWCLYNDGLEFAPITHTRIIHIFSHITHLDN